MFRIDAPPIRIAWNVVRFRKCIVDDVDPSAGGRRGEVKTLIAAKIGGLKRMRASAAQDLRMMLVKAPSRKRDPTPRN